MMVLLFLLCLLLAGCAAPTEAPPGQPVTVCELSTPPCQLEALGDNLLLITEEAGQSRFRLHSPADFSLLAEAVVPGTDFRVHGGFVSCFHEDTLTVLSADLSQSVPFPLSAPIVGMPLLTADGKTVYYSSGDTLHRLDKSADTVLLSQPGWTLTPTNLLLSDMQIVCRAEGAESRTLYLSPAGAVLSNQPDEFPLVTGQKRYYTHIYYGTCDVLYYGTDTKNTQMLPLTQGALLVDFLPELDSAVAVQDSQLFLFDLSTGKRTAAADLEDGFQPIRAVSAWNRIAVLTANSQGQQAVLLWNPALTSVADDTVYATPLYTEASPDLTGLNRCRERAKQVGSPYGITILLGADAVQNQPKDYLLTQEYIVPVLEEKLNVLEKRLAAFPKGLLKAMSDKAGGISLCLVRSIEGVSDMDALELAAGLHFWNHSGCILAVSAGESFQRAAAHELFHIMDEQLLTAKALTGWDSLNPTDFAYDRNYQDYSQHSSSLYLRPELRYFVDTYSMTFPAEDRARLLECAVTEGYSALFRAPALQAKLKALCTAIRTVYPIEDKAVLWEQYLLEPIR